MHLISNIVCTFLIVWWLMFVDYLQYNENTFVSIESNLSYLDETISELESFTGKEINMNNIKETYIKIHFDKCGVLFVGFFTLYLFFRKGVMGV